MAKCYVLRSHALLSSDQSLQRFGSNNVVVIPLAVIDEVASFTGLSLEKAKIRRSVLAYIHSVFKKGALTESGYKQANGSILRIVTNYRLRC